MSLDVLPFGVAHHMGLVPLLCLAWLHVRGQRRDVAWWWLAGAFFVSWLADTAAHYFNPWIGSELYPVTQAAIVGLVFLSRREALLLLATLLAVGVVDLASFGISSWDIMLRTVAWGAIAGLVYPLWQLGKLRGSLLVTFGLGLIAWYGYAIWPGWWSWGFYQTTRVLGIALFCWAATSPMPQLHLSKR